GFVVTLADGDGAVHGGEVDDGGGLAEFDAVLVVVPGFAGVVADAGFATHGGVAVGFDEHAGLVIFRDAEFDGTVLCIGLQAFALPSAAVEGDGDGAVFGVQAEVARVAAKVDGAILCGDIGIAGEIAHGDRAVYCLG